jgi:hypothetical protein
LTFFNRKEDVLDLQLTQYGKYLVSKGRFKPAFYAFSDDEVLYDVAYVSGSKELAAKAHERIQNDTVRFKALYETDGIETRVAQLNAHILEKLPGNNNRKRANLNRTPVDDVYGSDYADHVSMAPDDRKIIRNLIGTSQLGSQEVPSWNIRSRNNQKFILPITLSSSAGYGLSRPQLSMSVGHLILASEEDEDDLPEYEYSYQNGTEQEITFRGGIKLTMKENSILLSVAEDNVDFENENFDIEVFVIEDELVEATTGPSRRMETVTKLYIAKPNEWDRSDNINTYLDIKFDENIPEEMFEEQEQPGLYDFGPHDDDICEDSLYEGFERATPGQGISEGDTSSTLAGGPGDDDPEGGEY